MLTDQQIIAKYGQPGDTDNFTTIDLPYPMRIAWDTKVSVRRMQCHKKAAEPFRNVFSQLLAAYGLAELQRLEIDMFGGCVNVRLQRGSKTKWSRHAWGIAIDVLPQKNQLRWGRDRAVFAKPEYKKMIDIFYQNGFIGYGPERNYDWQHFELAK